MMYYFKEGHYSASRSAEVGAIEDTLELVQDTGMHYYYTVVCLGHSAAAGHQSEEGLRKCRLKAAKCPQYFSFPQLQFRASVSGLQFPAFPYEVVKDWEKIRKSRPSRHPISAKSGNKGKS